MSTITMQTMRYINLLDRVAHIKTRKCFVYNNAIYFAVPKEMISRAIGRNAENVKIIQEQLGKRVKIISEAQGISDAQNFIADIVEPVKFKSIEIKDNSILLTSGGTQNKAALFGRYKKRYEELRDILKDVFGLELKIL